MKIILCLCFAAVASLSVLAADDSDDAKALQGTWTPVKAELGGQPMSDQPLNVIVLELNKNEYEVTVAGNPDKGTWTVDSAAKPKAMTITGVQGPKAGKTFPAIHELKGDTLRICYDLSGATRPAEFKSTAGTKLYLVTYIRKKS